MFGMKCLVQMVLAVTLALLVSCSSNDDLRWALTGKQAAEDDIVDPHDDGPGNDSGSGMEIGPAQDDGLPDIICIPNCGNKWCGDDDGCQEKCIRCPEKSTCNLQTWVCDCLGSWCGSNCCLSGQTCGEGDTCQDCQSSCIGKECGNDGCGGSCGTCEASKCAGLTWTSEKMCVSGACSGGGETHDCDDGNMCTTDTCDPVTGCSNVLTGTMEFCNGEDDDCDGQTDEENAFGCVNYWYDFDMDGFGIGQTAKCLCAASGKYTAEFSGDCDDKDKDVNPATAEVCDGKDNDCDPATEDLDASTSIFGQKSCCHCSGVNCKWENVPNCENQDGIVVLKTSCDPSSVYYQLSSECAEDGYGDAKDNDCDGTTDEFCFCLCEFACSCWTEGESVICSVQSCYIPTRPCNEDCQTGTQTCNCGCPNSCSGSGQYFDKGIWSYCKKAGEPVDNKPSPEYCDGKDNDCDGLTDELGKILCGIGECRIEIPYCISGVLQNCYDYAYDKATTEVCDGKDNDCDGKTDENPMDLCPDGKTCLSGQCS